MVILVIYPDIIFLENFLMDYMLMFFTGKIIKKVPGRFGIILSSVIGSGYTVLFYLLPCFFEGQHLRWMSGVFVILNFGVVFLMLRIAFGRMLPGELFLGFGVCVVLSFVVGGILGCLEGTGCWSGKLRSSVMMLVGAFWFGYLSVKRFSEGMKEREAHENERSKVCIRLRGKEVAAKGLWDSGNSLYEPVTGKPVVIVEQELLEEKGIKEEDLFSKGYFAIPYHAIGTDQGILKGVLADELEISGSKGVRSYEKVLLGLYQGELSKTNEYQVILHPKL